eukprot:5421034-Pyramimonas_sp.AAC.1
MQPEVLNLSEHLEAVQHRAKIAQGVHKLEHKVVCVSKVDRDAGGIGMTKPTKKRVGSNNIQEHGCRTALLDSRLD